MPSKRLFRLHRAHRWFGLALLLPLLLLVATGILLNHTEELNLDRRHAGATLAQLYGIRPQAPEIGFPVGERWISQARNKIFLDHRVIGANSDTVIGAALVGGMLAVATPECMLLYTIDGRPIDVIDLPPRARPATRFTLVGRHPTMATSAGAYALNENMTAWIGIAGQPGEEVAAQPLPAPLRAAIADRLAATTLSWERVLLDLHSGRLFGPLGPWLVDLAALAVAILAITGSLMWLRVVRGRRQRR